MKGLWKVETSNFACVFTMKWNRDLVTAIYLFWVVFEKNAKNYIFLQLLKKPSEKNLMINEAYVLTTIINCCELAELASLRKTRELIVPVIAETKLAHISKTKHLRHMMYRTRNDYFHPYYCERSEASSQS